MEREDVYEIWHRESNMKTSLPYFNNSLPTNIQ